MTQRVGVYGVERSFVRNDRPRLNECTKSILKLHSRNNAFRPNLKSIRATTIFTQLSNPFTLQRFSPNSQIHSHYNAFHSNLKSIRATTTFTQIHSHNKDFEFLIQHIELFRIADWSTILNIV